MGWQKFSRWGDDGDDVLTRKKSNTRFIMNSVKCL